MFTKKLINMFLFIFILSLFSSLQAFAQPQISGISGNLVHGSNITITGSGFGIKNPAKPLYWADFETSINPTNLGQKTTWDWINPQMAFSNVQTPPNSTQSVRWNAGWNSNGACGSQNSDTGGVALLGEHNFMYIFVKRHYDFNWQAIPWNHKIFRFWRIGASNNSHTGYNGGANSGRSGAEYTGTDTDWHAESVPSNTWITQELIYKTSDINIENGVWKYFRWCVGDPACTQSGGESGGGIPWKVMDRSDQRHRTDTWPNKYNQFYLQDDISNESICRSGLWIYYDDIYMDSTWARVMIGNASTLAASTIREIQIPSSWSYDTITITLNRGAFTNFNNAYLYVIDANSNINANGYPLCPGCPKAPSNLQVQ